MCSFLLSGHIHFFSRAPKGAEMAAAVPLAALAVAYWVRDRYRYDRARDGVTRVQWAVLLGITPLWVVASHARGEQSARRDPAVVLTTAAAYALGNTAAVAIINDSALRTRQQALGLGVGAIESFGWTAYDVLAYGGCRAGPGADDALAAAALLGLAAARWAKLRYTYNRAPGGVTRAQWLVLLGVVPLYAFASFVGGLQVARRDLPAVVLSATAQAVGSHYLAVVLLNDSLLASRAQLASLGVTLLLHYAWAAHDVLQFSQAGEVDGVVGGGC
jgi:type III secretory pathway component EscS